MEGSRGPPSSFVLLKGATLPGYRSGHYRSQAHTPSHHPNVVRRNSDSDLSETNLVKEKCRKYESRFWASYRSESPSGESGTIISDPKEPSASWESPDLAPQFSSRPTITPLAAPASPRPQVRRSFNTFPRPWKARSRSPSPFRLKDQASRTPGDSNHIKSFSDSLKHIQFSVVGKREGEACENKRQVSLYQEDGHFNRNSPTYKSISCNNRVAPLDSSKENEGENSSNIYRSVATISVSNAPSCSADIPFSDDRNPYIENDFCTRVNEENSNKLKDFLSENLDNNLSFMKIQQVVKSKDETKTLESTSKCICEDREKKSGAPVASLAKFSSCGSSVPLVLEDKLGSAPLSCDIGNCALLNNSNKSFYQSASSTKQLDDKQLLCDPNDSEFVNLEKHLRFEEQKVSLGGSGLKDREAPLSESNAHNLMQASGKKIVRKKPEIPDKLSRRRSIEERDTNVEYRLSGSPFLAPSHSFSCGSSLKLPNKDSLPSTVGTVKPRTGNDSAPTQIAESKSNFLKNRTTVSQILSTLNSARFRLEELTGALGGSKKEGGKGSPSSSGRGPPSRPPRTRHDYEKLKKSTERLKSTESKVHVEAMAGKQQNTNVGPKNKKGKLVSARHSFLSKHSIVRTNSSPASTVALTDSLEHSSSLSDRRETDFKGDSGILQNLAPSNLLTPPQHSGKLESPVQSRDIPFRSASVSQGDLCKEKASGKASPNLKLYPACKESWGSHTLPRCSSFNHKKNNAVLALPDKQIPLTLSSSFDDFNKFKPQFHESREKRKKKSRSVVLLSSSESESFNIFSPTSKSLNFSFSRDPNECESTKEIEESYMIQNLFCGNFTDECSVSGKEFDVCTNKNIDSLFSENVLPEKMIGNELSVDGENIKIESALSETGLEIQPVHSVSGNVLDKQKSSEQISDFTHLFIECKGNSINEAEKSISGGPKDDIENVSGDENLIIKDDTNLFLGTCTQVGENEANNENNISSFSEVNESDNQTAFRKDSNIVCRVVETEARRSQCLVIRSSSFNKSKEGLEVSGEDEPQATSECRVVQRRQRLSLEDSEGESTDREGKSLTMRSEQNDERNPMEEIFPRSHAESSDSSSQDSVGIHSKRNKTSYTNLPIEEEGDFKEINDSRRRKKCLDEFQDVRDNGSNENMCFKKPNKVSKRQENLRKFNRHFDHNSDLKTDSYLSDSESRPNSYSEPEYLQLVVPTTRSVEKSERKRKNRSDPGFKRSRKDDATAYFSDSTIESFSDMKRKASGDKKSHVSRFSAPMHGIVSQTSTDSEGRDEFGPSKRNSQEVFRHSRSQTPRPRYFTPSVILSGQESDASCQDILGLEYAGNRSISRNASPCPYLGDSDSGERCIPRSPHGPRRYSKRPLRGPYGEMLEAEMSKSKSSSQFLSEDIYLRPRESNSTSPRPSSPASPTTIQTNNHESPFAQSPSIFVAGDNGMPRPSSHPVPASRSLDDSALRLFYSTCMQKDDSHHLKPLHATYESDNEGGLALLPSGPMHQRTASSPSKLFFETGCTSEEDQGHIQYYSQNHESVSISETPSSKPEEETLPPSLSDVFEKDSEIPEVKPHPVSRKSSKSKHERYSKSPKGRLHKDEEHRPHSSQKQSLKKGTLDSEFRALAEHRHMHRRHRDTRAHIMGEIYETEKNYVENLSFILTRYEQPLRSSESSAIIEPSLVDDIFFQVPEIYNHHQRLLNEFKQSLESGDANICLGNILLKMLQDPTVAESYKSFVNNWKTAKEAANTAVQAKPAFRHFLGAMAKEHPGKLDLKALLITPVQRFPHYELILKRLSEHTSLDHPDHSGLKEAIEEVQKVAASINDIEQEALQQEQQQFILKEIENFIEGLVGLVQPDRTFLQLDLVTQNSGLGIRKERCLFLFSDILVITAIKRRSATIRKSSSLQLALLSSLESCKLKLFKFISLDDLEIGRSRDDSMKKLVKELESLEQDLQTLAQISRLMKTLHFPKGGLEDALHDLDSSLKKQLMDRQGADSQLSELELNINTQEGIESLTFMFNSSEKRNKWEEGFNAAKQKLAMSADRRPPPEFVTALPIRKTRAGLQFTCAAPTLGLNAHNLKDVWVCNSDGYVGQVCVMSLQPDPTLACCNGVCNAKILSIASIPAAPHPDSSDEDEDEETSLEEDIRKRRSESLPPEIGLDENDSQQPTMWLGTEDGSIHVYNCNDTIRTKKNKFKFQPGSPVHCIIHIEHRVFASLANGDVVVYERDSQGGWNSGERHVVTLSTAAAPVTRMVMAAGKLWCSASNNIRILNISTLQVEHSFLVGGDNGKGVACMVCAGHGVWIAMHYSAVIRLHHATTYDCVCEVSVTSPVTKMLAGCDDIIRQHKLACLKVTALLACKDLLWVGTSAGVIIILPLPHLSHNTRRLQSPLNMVGIPHGHTGNVRFLTCVEMTPETRPSRLKSHSRYSFKGKDHPHHQSGTAAPSKLLVLSGGDGYEDFRNSGLSELAGRDDSTNHLLLWQV